MEYRKNNSYFRIEALPATSGLDFAKKIPKIVETVKICRLCGYAFLQSV